jgi:signal recognition particle subunit SRP54
MTDFTLHDYRLAMKRAANPGILERIARLMMTREIRKILADEEWLSECRCNIGIVDAMTSAERLNSKLIERSRVMRIARGAGVTPKKVRLMLKQFDVMAVVVKLRSSQGTG